MIPSALPLISEDDYPFFQRLIEELRHSSYEEWLGEHQKAVAYRQERNGYTEIPVSPGAFVAWVKERQEEAHLELLWVFAEDKAAGRAPLRPSRKV